jgi:DNA-binding NarL/FixJ family response regulator
MITVGIVEDDKGIRETLKFYLDKDKSHFAAVYAFNSVEAFLAQIPLLSSIQIVVLDINLPGMSGIEGIKPIKELLPNADIMMMTVMDDSTSVFNSLCAGAAGYVNKETPLNKIKEAIISLSDGGSPITPAIARKVVAFFKPDKKFKEDLTPREKDIIQGIVDGLSYKLIADRLGISHDTVRKHILSTYRKLHINSKGELLAKYHKGNIT